MRIFKGRVISPGKASGEAIISRDPISFYGGVDPDTGIVLEKGHALEGRSIAGKILIFPGGKGSTVGSYIIYRMKKNGKAPLGMVCIEAEPIVAIGAIISDIPLIDKIDEEILEIAKDGDEIVIDGSRASVIVL